MVKENRKEVEHGVNESRPDRLCWRGWVGIAPRTRHYVLHNNVFFKSSLRFLGDNALNQEKRLTIV